MAIDTNDKKLALINFLQPYQPQMPLDETAGFDQGDKQQLLWTYPGIAFITPTPSVRTGAQRPGLSPVGYMMVIS